jgi:hypothetical protein
MSSGDADTSEGAAITIASERRSFWRAKNMAEGAWRKGVAMHRASRLLVLPILVVGVPALMLAVLADTAYAKGGPGAKPVRVSCTSVSGNPSTGVTISGCNEPAVTGGTGTFPGGSLGTSGNVTVTWNTGGTTTFSYSETTPASSHCPVDPTSSTGAKEIEAILHGAVRSNTIPPSMASTDGGVKAAVTAKLCLTGTLTSISLLPPKPFKL